MQSTTWLIVIKWKCTLLAITWYLCCKWHVALQYLNIIIQFIACMLKKKRFPIWKYVKILQSINFAKQPVNLNEIRTRFDMNFMQNKKNQQNSRQNVSLNFFVHTRTKTMTNSFGWLIFTTKNQIRIKNQRCELDCSRAICRITKQPFQFFSCACPFI